MAYTEKRLVTFTINSADSAAVLADDADVFALVIPAGREVEIHGMKAYVINASDTSTDSIELVKEDNTVLAQCFLNATGAVSAKAAGAIYTASNLSFPVRVAPQSATVDKAIKLRINGATDATTLFTVQFFISGLEK
jgi:hypothetical protein